MSRHTPGPWTVDEASERGGYMIASGVLGENRYCVIAARGDWDHRAAESLANAHLIAAAPELLATWRDYIDLWNVEHEIEDCPGDDTCRCPLVARINAAIAKAEGRGFPEKCEREK